MEIEGKKQEQETESRGRAFVSHTNGAHPPRAKPVKRFVPPSTLLAGQKGRVRKRNCTLLTRTIIRVESALYEVLPTAHYLDSMTKNCSV